MKSHHLEIDDQELLESYKRDEWQSLPQLETELQQYRASAAANLAGSRFVSVGISAVADGNAKDVRREIFERAFARTDRTTIDDPALFPGLRRHLAKQLQLLLLERITKLGAENLRQRFDRHEKLPPHRQPRHPIWRQTAAGKFRITRQFL